MIRIALAALLLALCPAVAHAQSAPASPAPAPSPSASPSPLYPAIGDNDPCTTLLAIVTRPTVTNSVCTVRPNHVLIETGYQNTSADGGGNTAVYPQALIRVGTAVPALELDITPPGAVRTNTGGAIASGTSDAGVGLKYVLGHTPKLSYGVQAGVTGPTGTNGFSAGGTQYAYALNAGYALGPVFSLAATTTLSSLTNGTQRYASFAPSLVLAAAASSTTSVYAEAAEFTHAVGPGSATRTQYIGGVSHSIGDRLQLDAEFGISRTEATGRYRYVGFGISRYF